MASLPETLHVRVKQKMAGVYVRGTRSVARCIFLVSSPAMLPQIRGHSFTFLLNLLDSIVPLNPSREILSVYFSANKNVIVPVPPRCDTKTLKRAKFRSIISRQRS